MPGHKPVRRSMVYCRQPSIVEIQILRVGQFVVLCVPGELTTMAGRRLREAMQAQVRGFVMPLCHLDRLCHRVTCTGCAMASPGQVMPWYHLDRLCHGTKWTGCARTVLQAVCQQPAKQCSLTLANKVSWLFAEYKSSLLLHSLLSCTLVW